MIDYNLKNCNGYRYVPASLPSVLKTATPCVKVIWSHLLMRASYKQDGGIKRGQTLASIEDIREETSWISKKTKCTFSIQEIRTAIAYLKKHGIILTKKLNGGYKGLLITFCFYNEIQTYSSYDKRFNMEFQHCSGEVKPNNTKELNKQTEDVQRSDVNLQHGFEVSIDNKNKNLQETKNHVQHAMSILTTTTLGERVLDNNIYTRIIRDTENNENFNENFNETEQDMMPEYDNEFEENVMQYEREKRDREGYSYDPDEEDLEANCDDLG